MALNLIDIEDPEMIPTEVIDAGLRFMKERYDAGDKVFSHCIAGHSRGPTMMLMFLRTIGEMGDSFLGAERKFHSLYQDYDPGKGLRQHARSRWKELKNFKF
jgi:hypothetical protein